MFQAARTFMGQPNPRTPEPRRHHYVPKCWLAGFTESSENDGRLWVTDFSRQAQWPSTPDKAGHRRDFYRLSDRSPDPVAVEKFFSSLEDKVAPILRSIDQERRWPNNDELDVLLCFMAYQVVRVPWFRPFLLGILDEIARENLAKQLKSPETWTAALEKEGIGPDVPGAGYESVKEAFESGDFRITAETIWYMQMAFPQAVLLVLSLCYSLAALVFVGARILRRYPVATYLKATNPTMLTPLSAILALLIAFLAARVWTNLDHANTYAAQEASAINECILLSSTLPGELPSTMRNSIHKYIHFVAVQDEPAMKENRAEFRLSPQVSQMDWMRSGPLIQQLPVSGSRRNGVRRRSSGS
jgi:hypothetical protein